MTNKKAFVVMPFRQPFNSYYRGIFRPALKSEGYEVFRADDSFVSGPIVEGIRESIQMADLILCEMSDRNPNVFYELGLAHAIGKPAILVSNTEKDIPFDVQHIRSIIYDSSELGWERKLQRSIRAAAKDMATLDLSWPAPLIPRATIGTVSSQTKGTKFRFLMLMRCVHFEQDVLIDGVRSLINGDGYESHKVEIDSLGALCGQYDVYAVVNCDSVNAFYRFSELLKAKVGLYLRQIETRQLLPETYFQNEAALNATATQLVLFSCRPDFCERALRQLRALIDERQFSPFIVTHAGRTFGASDLFCLVHTPARADYSDFVRFKLAECFKNTLQYFDFITLHIFSPLKKVKKSKIRNSSRVFSRNNYVKKQKRRT